MVNIPLVRTSVGAQRKGRDAKDLQTLQRHNVWSCTEEWRGFNWCGTAGRACWSEGKAKSQRLTRTQRKEKVSTGRQVKSGKGMCEAEQDGKVATIQCSLECV